MRAVERQTGQTPQMLLDAPPLPQGCEELWRIFRELHSCRGCGFDAPMPITYVDIDAFQRVTATKLRPWEMEAIRGADRAFLDEWREQRPKPTP